MEIILARMSYPNSPSDRDNMTNYKDLLAKKAELEALIDAARKSELSEAVTKVRELVAEYGLTAEDVFKKASDKKVRVVEVKYKNSHTGETWTGRGKAPKWIQGQDREQFLVNK